MTLYLSLVTCYQTIQQSRRRIWVSFSSVFLNFKPISRSLLERCITGYCIGLVAIAHALRYWSWTVVDGRCRRESWCASKGSCLRLRDIVGCSYSVPRFEFVASRSICFGRERTAGEKNLTKKKTAKNQTTSLTPRFIQLICAHGPELIPGRGVLVIWRSYALGLFRSRFGESEQSKIESW